MNNEQLIYLAVPFSHDDPEIQKKRFHKVNKVAAKLLSRGHFVFSPISHSYPIAQDGTLEGDWNFWQSYCRKMVSLCDVVYVLTLDGWKESVGVQREIAIANELGLHVHLIDEGLKISWADDSSDDLMDETTDDF